MCLWAHATTSAIHVRLILPGSVMGDYPPGCAILPFTRIWPFSALVDNPWKWCASCWRKIAISNNVGSVKYVIGTQLPALGDERHFALVEGFAFQPKARSQSLRSGTQSDPTISSITTSIMITTSNSP